MRRQVEAQQQRDLQVKLDGLNKLAAKERNLTAKRQALAS